jgi:Raf kinase inhibitor-like YbhB/YbcL family protein
VDGDPKTGFTVNSNTIPTHTGTVMGGINAFCQPNDETVVEWGGNVSPDLFFEVVPEGTKSFALLAYDPDAPASSVGSNEQNVTIEAGAERTRFFHWVLVDIPGDTRKIPEGAGGRGVVEGGKHKAKTEYGLRGLNDFTTWFADDPKMKGDYLGFDGACPPWNDERIHRYVFSVHALDVASLGLKGRFTGQDVEAKMKDHLLASASFTTVYWLNPSIQMP